MSEPVPDDRDLDNRINQQLTQQQRKQQRHWQQKPLDSDSRSKSSYEPLGLKTSKAVASNRLRGRLDAY